MTRKFNTGIIERIDRESGVSQLLEYLLISGMLLLFMVILIPTVNTVFLEGPTNQLLTASYIDIGNGVSTRIIDLYAIIPYYNNATITSKFDIPDDVAGRGYFVEIVPGPPGSELDRNIVISGSGVRSEVSLSGIGATVFGRSEGSTTASGLNYVEYRYP